MDSNNLENRISDHIQTKDKTPNASQEHPAYSKPPIWIMGVEKHSDKIWIKIRIPYPTQEPWVTSKALICTQRI